jgi:hypothetical protein
MPTTVADLAAYILLLVPGLVFVFTRERHRPTVRRSVFRETATVIFASAITVAIVVAVVAITSWFWPWLARTLRRLAGQDPTLLADHVVELFLGGCLLIVLASLLAWLFGTKWAHSVWSKRPWNKSLVEQDASAWNVIFGEAEPNERVLVGCQLKSGWWVEGALFTFDNSGDSDPNRALTLTGEIASRGPDAKDVKPITGYGSMVVEAGEIEFMLVAYEAVSSTVASADRPKL